MMSQGYDYVIVGGGSSGCVLAARLSENPSARVCLILIALLAFVPPARARTKIEVPLFEGGAGMSRCAGRGDSSEERGAKRGCPKQQPAATVEGVQKSQSGSFPKPQRFPNSPR